MKHRVLTDDGTKEDGLPTALNTDVTVYIEELTEVLRRAADFAEDYVKTAKLEPGEEKVAKLGELRPEIEWLKPMITDQAVEAMESRWLTLLRQLEALLARASVEVGED